MHAVFRIFSGRHVNYSFPFSKLHFSIEAGSAWSVQLGLETSIFLLSLSVLLLNIKTARISNIGVKTSQGWISANPDQKHHGVPFTFLDGA
jgi:hypothetical protein